MNHTNFMEKLLDRVEVEWKTLEDEDFVEIANRGRKPVKSSLRVIGKTPYYGANNIQDYVEGHTHDGEYVLIAEDGSASLERYSIQYVTGKFWANTSALTRIAPLLLKKLTHSLQNSIFCSHP